MNKYEKRLFNEWLQHDKIVIGVDFDSTISHWHTIDNHKDIERCISVLKKAQQTGCYITIHTACDKSRYQDILNHCASIGIEVNSINENPIELPYGQNSKIYANIFLDDRAGLNEALDTLETAMYAYIGEIQSDIIASQQNHE